MQLGVWSPYHQIGNTSLTIALSSYLALNYKFKMLVTHSQYVHSTMEEVLGIKIKSDINIFSDSGLDALERLTLASKLSSQQISNYTDVIFPNKLELLTGSEKSGKEFLDDMSKRLNIILSLAKEIYSYVFVDIASGIYNDVTKKTIASSDIVIITLNQNSKVLDDFFNVDTFKRNIPTEKQIIVINNYDQNSKYSMNYIKKKYKPQYPIFPLHYNVNFRDSINDNNVVKFMELNKEVSRKDDNYLFVEDLKAITSEILKIAGYEDLDFIQEQHQKSFLQKLFNR